MAPRTFGSIRVLPSGRFQARYRPKASGARAQTFDTEAEAVDFLNTLQAQTQTQAQSQAQAQSQTQAQTQRGGGNDRPS